VICDEVIEIIPEWSSDYDATSLLNWIEEFIQKGAIIERGSGIPNIPGHLLDGVQRHTYPP
jgi:hypothetical protein